MTTIAADMVDAIFSHSSADVADSTTVTLVPADANRRPFVSFVRLEASAGAVDVRIGTMIVAIHTDLYSGLTVGNKGDAVTLVTNAVAGVKRYAFTGGYLRISAGGSESGVKDS